MLAEMAVGRLRREQRGAGEVGAQLPLSGFVSLAGMPVPSACLSDHGCMFFFFFCRT